MAAREYRWRHLVLLVLLVALYIITPFVVAPPFGIVIMNVMGSAVFLAGVYAVIETKWLFIITGVLTVCSVLLTWRVLVTGDPRLALASQTALTLMLSLFAVGILIYVLRPGRITADKIYAAICVYLLIGFAWSFAYSIVEQ